MAVRAQREGEELGTIAHAEFLSVGKSSYSEKFRPKIRNFGLKTPTLGKFTVKIELFSLGIFSVRNLRLSVGILSHIYGVCRKNGVPL